MPFWWRLCDRLEQRVGVRILVERRWGHCPKAQAQEKTLHATGDTARITAVKSAVLAGNWAVNLADLVFVDETGSNLSMTRRYARALKATAL